VAADDFLTVGEDDTVPTAGNVLTDGADTDIEGDTLSVTAVEGEAGFVGSELAFTGSGALLTLNSDGSYVYDPNGKFEYLGAGESAIETFSYTVSDGNGGSDTATVSITVNGANDAAVVGGQDTGTTAPGAQEGELNAQAFSP
jgi:VCBS repeat-containing protein